MALDALIRFLFSDEGASAGVGKVNAALNQLKRSGPDARRGLAALETGMRGLAFQAVGVSGPLGKVVESLLRFGGGSGLILGVAAGVGAVALAYRALTKDSRDLAEEQSKLHDEIRRTARAWAESKTPATVRIGQDVGEQRARLVELDAQRERRLRQLIVERSDPATDKTLIRIDTERANISAEIAINRRRSADATADEARAAKDIVEEARKLRLELIEFGQAGGAATADPRGLLARQVAGQFPRNRLAIDALAPRGFSAAALRETGEAARLAGLPGEGAQAELAEERLGQAREFTARITRDMLTPQQVYLQQMGQLRQAQHLLGLSTADVADAERHLASERDRAMGGVGGGTSQFPNRLAAGLSLGTAALSAARGGGVGGVFSAGGAFAATFPGGQIPGIALAGLGTIVSLFEGQHREREAAEDRRHAELIGVLHEGPQRATITIVNANGETIGSGLYSVQRANRLGREARLPR